MKKYIGILSAVCLLTTLSSCREELALDTPLYAVESDGDLNALRIYVHEAGGNQHYTEFTSTSMSTYVMPEDTVAFHVRLNNTSNKDVVVKGVVQGLPEGSYRFVDGHEQVTIRAGQRISERDIRITLLESDVLEQISLTSDTYATVSLEVLSGNATTGKNLNSYSWVVRNRYREMYLSDEEGLNPYDTGDWSLLTNFFNGGRLYDGDLNNFGYAYLYDNPYLTFDMGEKVPVEALGFYPYFGISYYTIYFLGRAEVLISDDNTVWESKGTITFKEPAFEEVQTVRFYAPVSARYFKVVPLLDYAQSGQLVILSEVSVYGN